MEENLDPSIAALLANITPSDPDDGNSSSDDVVGGIGVKESNFEQMIMEQSAPQKKSGPVPEVDLSIKEFKPIEKVFENESQHYFDDPTYYKTAIAGEGQNSNRLHMVLSKYLSCKDIKDKMVYRQQVTMAYWELVHSMAPKTAGKNFPLPKRMMLRFSVLLPSLFRPEHREFFEKSILENNTNEPVFYMDEWFKYISARKAPRKSKPVCANCRAKILENCSSPKTRSRWPRISAECWRPSLEARLTKFASTKI